MAATTFHRQKGLLFSYYPCIMLSQMTPSCTFPSREIPEEVLEHILPLCPKSSGEDFHHSFQTDPRVLDTVILDKYERTS
jgi:hypothetical protein